MSQRRFFFWSSLLQFFLCVFSCSCLFREHCEDGGELMFDHGAPCFAVSSSNLEVQSLVDNWESRGLVAQWKEKFGSFDFSSRRFVGVEEVSLFRLESGSFDSK